MTLSHDFIHELKKRFTGDLRLDAASKVLYSTDASIYQISPLGVALPKNQEDLHAAVELAFKYRVPILPRGSGSSLGGQAIGEALILDCSRYLDSIVEIDPDSRTALVEPGVILASLNRAAAQYGLMYGPDPASAERATMGGVIGNNATGAHSILYGMSADHLLAADVILSDGSLAVFGAGGIHSGGDRSSAIDGVVREIRGRYSETIREHYPRSWRNSAGYRLNYLLPWSPSAPPQWTGETYPAMRPGEWNLAPLLAGSEGTLAVFRRMKVNLVRRPTHTILGVLSYESIAAACDDVPRLLEFKPSAIELIPQMIIQLARSVPAYARQMGWMVGDPAAVLVVEFSGEQVSALKEAVRSLSGENRLLTVAESAEDQARVWNIRKMGLGILDSRPKAAKPVAFVEDCAIPVERLGDFVREVEKILAAHGTYGGIYAHASAGCLHIRPVLDLQRGEGVRAMRSIVEQVFVLTAALGGSMSSEHGDGIVSGEFIERTYGRELTDVMRKLKRAADPDGILNPKKLFDAPPMDSQLRFGEAYRSHVWTSTLHFEHERGFAGAIEQCNGQGVCRKTTGVMCPSFQATRDEAFSTRGRSNLLRALMSLRDGSDGDLEQAAFESLDLCLACKGCTSECPSGVDMPKLKYEFMDHYYRSHGRPLRDYLFGYFHVAARWLSLAAPLVNLFMRMGWSRRWIAGLFGITPHRPFPQFAPAAKAPAVPMGTGKKQVLFLSDVFSHFIEPEVEAAAFDILTAMGFEVRVLPVIGAGASLLSKGFLDAARRHAEHVLVEIRRFDGGAGWSVVGCEPPEVYCLKHEYASLLPARRAEIESITKRAWLVDEFILRVVQAGDYSFPAPLHGDSGRLTLQPHCHQRAEGLAADGLPSGLFATAALLKMTGRDVDVLDAGCCGMAGTFGYDAGHYDLSMQVGELGVLPKVREARARGVDLAAGGAACRMQIRHGAGVEAAHPLVLVRDHLLSHGGAHVETNR